MRFEAVVFDLDDTIYPEWDYTRSGFVAVEEALIASGVLQASADRISEEWYRLRRTGEPKVFDRWIEGHDPRADRCIEHWGDGSHAIEALIELFRSHEPTISPFPGIVELIHGLRQRDCRIGLVSDGSLSVQRSKFRALGLAQVFDSVVFSDELGRANWKPSTAPFTEVLRQLDVSADVAVYVADNPLKDFLGPRRCGMQSIRLHMSSGVYSGEVAPSVDHAANVTVHGVSQLSELLAQRVS